LPLLWLSEPVGEKSEEKLHYSAENRKPRHPEKSPQPLISKTTIVMPKKEKRGYYRKTSPEKHEQHALTDTEEIYILMTIYA